MRFSCPYLYLPLMILLLYFSSPGQAGIVEIRQTSNNLQGTQNIGGLVPISGLAFGALGNDVAAGMRKGVTDFNQKLPANAGWSLQLNISDTQAIPAMALKQLQALKAMNITLVLGPITSASVNATKPCTANNEALLFSPSSVATAHSTPGDGVFRLVPDANTQADFYVRQLQGDNIDTLIMVYRDDTWGRDFSQAISSRFTQNGGVVHQTFSYSPPTADFTPSGLIQEVNNNVVALGRQKGNLNNVAIVVLSFGEITDILASAEEVSTSGSLDLGNLWWYGAASTYPQIISNTTIRDFAQSVRYTTVTLEIDTSLPIYRNVRAAIQQMANITREPDFHSYIAYDTAQILGKAIEAADSTEPAMVIRTLPSVARDYNGFVGNAALNQNGDLMSANYQRWEVRNGHWHRVTSGIVTYTSSSVLVILFVSLLTFLF